MHCRHCGYAWYRTATRSSARKIYYYRCLGSDAWRYAGKARCTERPVRQDLLEPLVWRELMRLLEDPTLIKAELNRRLECARNSSPIKRREETLHRELVQTNKRMERLLSAYQEELLSLDELHRRMPELRGREQRLHTELATLQTQVADQATTLRLAQTLSAFLESLRAHAQTLDVRERQRIARLLVKEVVVGHDRITIRHSIPNAVRSGGNPSSSNVSGSVDKTGSDKNYLLCPWHERAALRRAHVPALHHAIAHDSAIGIRTNQPNYSGARDAPSRAVNENVVADPVEELFQVNIHHDCARAAQGGNRSCAY